MNIDQLDRVRIASPCTVKWSAMRGDDRARFCEQCCLTVYNLSELTRDEALRLVQTREGRTCVQLFRRLDGTILTRDCERGLLAVRRHFEVQLERANPRGPAWLVFATVVACFIAAVLFTFGDNLKALFGASTGGALAGDTQVTRRINTPSNNRRPVRLSSFQEKTGY
ncbi:MAG: hypothetical protein JNM17_33535 [Archangium sp.]|nr:hypothetical protein [Archangium sp.]